MTAPKLVVLDGGKPANESAEDYIRDVFGIGGLLARQMPGYSPREGQIKLARTFDRAIREERHAIGEGPVGTGKTAAYLIPAIYHAAKNNKRICVVTANKNLQRQIFNRDLPMFANAVPWKVKYAIRKGINSYLCLRNYQDVERSLESEFPEYHETIEQTLAWAEKTKTGDFEDSPGPPPKVWARLSTSREECDGRKCVDYEDCFVKAARDASVNAKIIVTNYHLFLLHLKFGLDSKILPQFDVVILDEAHNAATIARDFFGEELTWGALYRCIGKLHMIDVRGFKKAGEQLRDVAMGQINALWGELGARARAKRHLFSQANTLPSEQLEGTLKLVGELYKEVVAALAPKDGGGKSDERSAHTAEYQKLAELCDKKREVLAEFRIQVNEHNVYFIEGSGYEEKGRYVRLKSKAVEVGGAMRTLMFERYKTVIQTSATLAVRGGKESDFVYLKREMGMGKMGEHPDLNIEEVTVPSPFEWPKQALLVIPRSMPTFEQNSEKWDNAVCEHIERVVNTVHGRTLGLFTSFRMLTKARDHLRANTKWRVLAQGESTNRELADEFQKDVHSVLLGTESFSEGVSIEGEACSCVILDKIPFVNQDDPVISALERRYKQRGGRDSVFQTHMLPEAIISFKQRVGRLIRTVNDVGVVVVLDRRLLDKNYRNQFLKSIPPLRQEDSLDAIAPFLRGVGAL